LGWRVVVRGLEDPQQRLEAYRQVQFYQASPRRMTATYAAALQEVQADVQAARDAVVQVKVPEAVSKLGLAMVQELKIDSLRAEITLFEAARAYAALDGRSEVSEADLRAVAPMALRMRRSAFMEHFFTEQSTEETEIQAVIQRACPPSSS